LEELKKRTTAVERRIGALPMLDTGLRQRRSAILLVLRLLDADRKQDFERGIRPDARERRKAGGFHACCLEVGRRARPRTIRPRLA
jgi:hypothetical protein